MMSIECRYRNPLAASASLGGISGFEDEGKRKIGRTRRRRFTPGFLDVKSMMFPPVIHSETMHNGNSSGEIPNTGRTFG
jgi:hypothetical protein